MALEGEGARRSALERVVDLRELLAGPSVFASVTGDLDLGAAAARFEPGDLPPAEGGFGGACCSDGVEVSATIGVGRLGTLGTSTGTGAGYGTSYGGGTPRHMQRSEPRVHIERPEIVCEGCAASKLQSQFRRCGSSLRYCYEKVGLVNGLRRERLTVELLILPGGRIGSVTLTGGSDDLRECIRGHYEGMTLLASGELVAVTIRVRFDPT
jgi:hypothetical protein